MELKRKEAEVREQALSAEIRKAADADLYRRQQQAQAATPVASLPMMVILSIWDRGWAILPAISGSTWMSISAMAALLYFW